MAITQEEAEQGMNMYLYNDNWEVEISEINYNPDSADNVIQPDDYIVLNEDFPKTVLIKILDANHSEEKSIVLSVSFFTPHDQFAFIMDNDLFMFLNDTVCNMELQTGRIVKRSKLDISGSLVSVHLYRDDFILYCEMNIIRMNQNLDVIWNFMARDIFVRYKGEEPAFEMKEDRIQLYDFSDNYYEIDYDGKVIVD